MRNVQFKDFSKSVKEIYEKQIKENLNNAQNVYMADVKKELDLPPSRTGKDWTHLPHMRIRSSRGEEKGRQSVNNEPPAPQTRELIESIFQSDTPSQGNISSGMVGSSSKKAKWMEVGTDRSGFKMSKEGGIAPRPVWYKTLVANKETYGTHAIYRFRRKK